MATKITGMYMNKYLGPTSRNTKAQSGAEVISMLALGYEPIDDVVLEHSDATAPFEHDRSPPPID